MSGAPVWKVNLLQSRTFDIEGPIEIVPARFGDERGFFSETWNRRSLADVGISLDFVQDNHSLSATAGTLRGLHFQRPPHAQAKLVRVLSGAIFDVVVDIRAGSPTFGRWIGLELSREKWNQVFVPEGFAHGFLTLTPNTEVVYKASDHYSLEHDCAIQYNDPSIGIEWPQEFAPFKLSEKDRSAPRLADIDTGFVLNV